jgi:hypothetical protein
VQSSSRSPVGLLTLVITPVRRSERLALNLGNLDFDSRRRRLLSEEAGADSRLCEADSDEIFGYLGQARR